MAETLSLTATPRTEFGKGAARRARREFLVPAVLYGHGADTVHMNLPALEYATILRNHGTNAIITLDVDGKNHLALTKDVVVHPTRNYIVHADLVTVRRGEKVVVDVPVILTGEPAPSTLVYQDVTTMSVEADALSIPEEIEISIEGIEAGTQILAGEITIPGGATLDGDPETLLVNIVEQSAVAEENEEIIEEVEAEVGAGAQPEAESEDETSGEEASSGEE
ncbi:MAG: 50S ribosomal protein L25/general stress protein Ctc [Tomitella sp.]|nr:50S ribosomal protein L25/general stress protein Ctc [Tomitella sp.]